MICRCCNRDKFDIVDTMFRVCNDCLTKRSVNYIGTQDIIIIGEQDYSPFEHHKHLETIVGVLDDQWIVCTYVKPMGLFLDPSFFPSRALALHNYKKRSTYDVMNDRPYQ